MILWWIWVWLAAPVLLVHWIPLLSRIQKELIYLAWSLLGLLATVLLGWWISVAIIAFISVKTALGIDKIRAKT